MFGFLFKDSKSQAAQSEHQTDLKNNKTPNVKPNIQQPQQRKHSLLATSVEAVQRKRNNSGAQYLLSPGFNRVSILSNSNKNSSSIQVGQNQQGGTDQFRDVCVPTVTLNLVNHNSNKLPLSSQNGNQSFIKDNKVKLGQTPGQSTNLQLQKKQVSNGPQDAAGPQDYKFLSNHNPVIKLPQQTPKKSQIQKLNHQDIFIGENLNKPSKKNQPDLKSKEVTITLNPAGYQKKHVAPVKKISLIKPVLCIDVSDSDNDKSPNKVEDDLQHQQPAGESQSPNKNSQNNILQPEFQVSNPTQKQLSPNKMKMVGMINANSFSSQNDFQPFSLFNSQNQILTQTPANNQESEGMNSQQISSIDVQQVQLLSMNTLLKGSQVVPSLMSSANYPANASTKIGLGSLLTPNISPKSSSKAPDFSLLFKGKKQVTKNYKFSQQKQKLAKVIDRLFHNNLKGNFSQIRQFANTSGKRLTFQRDKEASKDLKLVQIVTMLNQKMLLIKANSFMRVRAHSYTNQIQILKLQQKQQQEQQHLIQNHPSRQCSTGGQALVKEKQNSGTGQDVDYEPKTEIEIQKSRKSKKQAAVLTLTCMVLKNLQTAFKRWKLMTNSRNLIKSPRNLTESIADADHIQMTSEVSELSIQGIEDLSAILKPQNADFGHFYQLDQQLSSQNLKPGGDQDTPDISSNLDDDSEDEFQSIEYNNQQDKEQHQMGQDFKPILDQKIIFYSDNKEFANDDF